MKPVPKITIVVIPAWFKPCMKANDLNSTDIVLEELGKIRGFSKYDIEEITAGNRILKDVMSGTYVRQEKDLESISLLTDINSTVGSTDTTFIGAGNRLVIELSPTDASFIINKDTKNTVAFLETLIDFMFKNFTEEDVMSSLPFKYFTSFK